jgi:RNA polymerase sigma-70 factor (ECF subfamily)
MALGTLQVDPLHAADAPAPSTFPCGFVGPGEAADMASEGSSKEGVPGGDALAARAEIVERLHKLFYHRVFCFARRRAHDEVAEEVAHEAFVRLLRVRNLETMTVSVAYLLRIAENLLKRRHERARRYRSVLEHSGIVSGVSCGDARDEGHGGGLLHGHAAQVDGWVDAGRLDAVLAQLTREEQAAVRLIVCEGLDYQSAARSLGVPVSTINNWKHRGLSKLKQLVQRSGARAFDAGSLAAG